MVSLAMFVVPIKILHIKWTKMKEERLLEDRLRKAVSENEKVLHDILFFACQLLMATILFCLD